MSGRKGSVIGEIKVLWGKVSAIGEVQVLGRKELRIWRDKRVGNGKGVIFE